MKPIIKYIIIPIGSILGIGFIIFFIGVFSFVNALPNDVKLDKEIAKELSNDFLEYEKIFSMDDATRCVKTLNNIRIDLNEFSSSDSSCNQYAEDFEEVLTRFTISEQKYMDFRKRLEKSKLRYYHYEYGMQIYIVDGFLDNIWGYLYTEQELSIDVKKYYKLSNGYSIIITKDLGDNWYKIGGS